VPTVHLSLPEAVYSELKELAAELGIQVTDLIKVMIREGIEKRRAELLERRRRQQQEATETLIQVLQKIEKLQQQLEEYQTFVEGELYRINQSLKSLKHRVTKLEDMVEERLIPVETPELVQP
jgi:uncharacterized protein (DUF342 family)